MKKPFSRGGFTLVEILITMTLLALLMTGVMSFYIQSLKSMYASDQRMKLAAQINRFSNELIVQATRSNQFILYKSATPTDFDGPNAAPFSGNTDRQSIQSLDDVGTPLSPPYYPAGDFVVFVYYEIPKPTAQPYHRISKLEGYFLSTTTAGGIGNVKKVVIDLSAAPSTNTPEAILTAEWNKSAVFSTYFPMVRGLAKPQTVDGTAATAATAIPRLFYMSAARNVIITGQIYSSTRNIATNDWKTYTNSFCFNITPRT